MKMIELIKVVMIVVLCFWAIILIGILILLNRR